MVTVGKTMKALRVHSYEEPQQWLLEEVPMPVPGLGQVLVRVVANAISYVDLLHTRGGYQIRAALPFVPGTEFSGVVVACGAGVEAERRLRPGQDVTGTVFGGAWAEFACANAWDVEPLPAGVGLHAASALPITGATALYALKRRGHLQPGETVLVLGAGGGVGLACVQVAKALGARVVAGASAPFKREIARQEGADEVVDTAQPDWRAAVQAAAPEGVDVVVDTLGGAFTDIAFRTLRWGGRHLIIGFADGSIATLRTNLPLLKGSALIGVDVRQFREREPRAYQSNLEELVDLVARGAVQPRIADVYAIEDWQRAMEAAADRDTPGRVVLDWGIGKNEETETT